MKYNIPLALLAAARTLAEGVNAAFTVMPRSLNCSHFCCDLPAASSDRAIRSPGVPPIDRWWLLHPGWRTFLRDVCRILEIVACIWRATPSSAPLSRYWNVASWISLCTRSGCIRRVLDSFSGGSFRWNGIENRHVVSALSCNVQWYSNEIWGKPPSAAPSLLSSLLTICPGGR